MTKAYVKEKNKRILICTLYILLVFAVFSDLLRIPNTSITFFRLSLPICLIIIGGYPVYARKGIMIIGGFAFLTIIQYIIFYSIDRKDLQFSKAILIKFFVLYIAIITVFLLVKILQYQYKEKFEEKFFAFIICVGLILMIITLADYFDTKYLNSSFFGGLKVDNQNNYGCYIAAVFPFLLIEGWEKKYLRDIIGIAGTFFILFLNDSKAALFGVIISLIIFICINYPANTRRKLFLYRYTIVIMALIAITGLLLINPKINGYSLQDTILQPIMRIVQNRPYPDYGSSIAYRTNTTLYCLKKILATGALGVGMGNTGVLLKHDFPDLNPEYETALNSPFISLHNAWLEFALDLGLVVLIIYFVIIKYALKLYFKKSVLTKIEKLRVMFICSFPIWVISASGIYTQYFLIIVMAYLLFCKSENKEVHNENSVSI